MEASELWPGDDTGTLLSLVLPESFWKRNFQHTEQSRKIWPKGLLTTENLIIIAILHHYHGCYKGMETTKAGNGKSEMVKRKRIESIHLRNIEWHDTLCFLQIFDGAVFNQSLRTLFLQATEFLSLRMAISLLCITSKFLLASFMSAMKQNYVDIDIVSVNSVAPWPQTVKNLMLLAIEVVHFSSQLELVKSFEDGMKVSCKWVLEKKPCFISLVTMDTVLEVPVGSYHQMRILILRLSCCRLVRSGYSVSLH